MKKITLVIMTITLLFVLSGCTGSGVGGFFGYPGFIIDPIYYANTEVDGISVELNIRDIYAVVYTDSAGTPLDSSIWIYFVPKSIDLNDILTTDFKPFVALKINDVFQASTETEYNISQDLASTIFMTWMNVNDDKDVFVGDSIFIEIFNMSQTDGELVKGEFTSTLSRNIHMGLAEKFKFKAPVNTVEGTPPTL